MKQVIKNFDTFIKVCKDITRRQVEYEFYDKFQSSEKDPVLKKIENSEIVYRED